MDDRRSWRARVRHDHSADEQVQRVVGWSAGRGDVDGHGQASADSFIVEAKDGNADDGVMEALDPGVVEADVMRAARRDAERLAPGRQLPDQP
jgi:hypothetical protein